MSRLGHSTHRADVGAALYGLIVGAVRRIPREMSLTSSSTLSTLVRTGPRRVTDLAVIEGVSQPAMTVLIRVLEEGGMVERQADPTDKRVAIVAVTEKGASYLQVRRRAGADAFVELIEKLTDAEIASLVAAVPALERLRELDGEDREPPIRSTGKQAGASL
ncbi:MAG: slyA [Acidimicrobiaceae bacterium]|nr:slyA [Acidimicrobiaceae bacterium]